MRRESRGRPWRSADAAAAAAATAARANAPHPIGCEDLSGSRKWEEVGGAGRNDDARWD